MTDRSRARRKGSVDYFDEVADGYFDRYDLPDSGGESLRERKRRLFELLGAPGGRILDVGCGPGVMAADVTSAGWDFTGVDASPRMIRDARRRLSGASAVRFGVADATALPFRSGTFDAVICTGVIDRVPDRTKAVVEMARVLRPGGSLLVSFPNLASPYAMWRTWVFLPAVALVKRIVFASHPERRGPDQLSTVPLLTREQARRLVSRHAGPVEAVAAYSFRLFLSPLDEFFPGAAVRLTRRLEHLNSTRMAWLGTGFIVKAVKPGQTAESATPPVPAAPPGYTARSD